MATAALSTNIIPLPTAARRRVKNPAGFALVAASKDLPKHPAEWSDHGGGKNWEQVTFHRSPEMMVATAILKVLDDDQKARVRKLLGTMADLNFSPHAAAALSIVEGFK